MLVLTRNRDESIIIGDNPDMSKNIVITLIHSGQNRAKLGIQAPKEVPVHRSEVYEAIQKEKSCQN
jgi:carbon storage regulator